MAGHSADDIEFQVDYIYSPAEKQRGRYDTYSPWPIFRSTRRILAGEPDLLIVSLWRSCIVALLSKLLCRRLRLVLFLHFPSDAHWLDRFLTRHIAGRAYEIWADSQETLDLRLPSISPSRTRVISFVTRQIAPLPIKPVNPVFIFWGRLHSQKGLDRALGIFSAVHKVFHSARFVIIGPDGGDFSRIEALVTAMGLEDAVQFSGGMNFNAIMQQAGSASFYLQTSLLEGMAMSVVEAMQLGLVPVVTPVGEIGNYCRHDENALVVTTDRAIVSRIVSLLNDDSQYQLLRKNAVATWAAKPLYAESVEKACMEILLMSSDNCSGFNE
ncbi:MAG: glycosyltransferase family 4 protein [Halioglobus sp.]